MNDSHLEMFRQIHRAMIPGDRDWNWRGEAFGLYGVTRERAEAMQKKYGGSVWQDGKGVPDAK